MLAGTVFTTAVAVFILAGLLNAVAAPDRILAGENWVNDQGEVFSIRKSNDPFVRLIRPDTRLVRFIISDDDGGREITGQVDISLEPNEFPELRVGDILDVLRNPDDKGQSTLRVPQ